MSVIEGVLNFCDHEMDTLVRLFEPFSTMLGSAEQIRSSSKKYLKAFAEECLGLLNHFQRDGKELSRKVDNWSQSLTAAQSQEEGERVKIASLPNEIKSLTHRVTGVLEKTIHAKAIEILDDAVMKLQIEGKRVRPLVPDDLQLPYLMSFANDLVEKTAVEFNVDLDRVGKTTAARQERTIFGKQIQDFGLSSTGLGSRIYRFVISPLEQRETVIETLKKQNLLKTTCLLYSTSSLGSYIVCDGRQQNLGQSLSNLLRPSPETIQLAERLRTRVDIEWSPVGELFEMSNPESDSATASIGPSVDAPSLQTSPIPT